MPPKMMQSGAQSLPASLLAGVFKSSGARCSHMGFNGPRSSRWTWGTRRRELPGELERVMAWFRDYKIPDGKAPNGFGYGGAPLGAGMAARVISNTHALYLARHDQP